MAVLALSLPLPAGRPQHGMSTAAALEELLARVADGDREAFSHFYDRIIGTVFGLAKMIVRDPARAEEIAHDVMLEVWAKAGTFRPERGSARAWVATITRRRAIDVVRSEEASRARDSRSVQPEAVAGDPVADHVTDEEERERVRSGLHQLTDLQREAIELAFFGGLTYPQVAQRLDVPLGTVKTRMRDGLIRLATIMGAER